MDIEEIRAALSGKDKTFSFTRWTMSADLATRTAKVQCMMAAEPVFELRREWPSGLDRERARKQLSRPLAEEDIVAYFATPRHWATTHQFMRMFPQRATDEWTRLRVAELALDAPHALISVLFTLSASEQVAFTERHRDKVIAAAVHGRDVRGAVRHLGPEGQARVAEVYSYDPATAAEKPQLRELEIVAKYAPARYLEVLHKWLEVSARDEAEQDADSEYKSPSGRYFDHFSKTVFVGGCSTEQVLELLSMGKESVFYPELCTTVAQSDTEAALRALITLANQGDDTALRVVAMGGPEGVAELELEHEGLAKLAELPAPALTPTMLLQRNTRRFEREPLTFPEPSEGASCKPVPWAKIEKMLTGARNPTRRTLKPEQWPDVLQVQSFAGLCGGLKEGYEMAEREGWLGRGLDRGSMHAAYLRSPWVGRSSISKSAKALVVNHAVFFAGAADVLAAHDMVPTSRYGSAAPQVKKLGHPAPALWARTEGRPGTFARLDDAHLNEAHPVCESAGPILGDWTAKTTLGNVHLRVRVQDWTELTVRGRGFELQLRAEDHRFTLTEGRNTVEGTIPYPATEGTLRLDLETTGPVAAFAANGSSLVTDKGHALNASQLPSTETPLSLHSPDGIRARVEIRPYDAYYVVSEGLLGLNDGRTASIPTLVEADTDMAAYLLSATMLLGPEAIRSKARKGLSQMGPCAEPYREVLGITKTDRTLRFETPKFADCLARFGELVEGSLTTVERDGMTLHTAGKGVDASIEEPLIPTLVLAPSLDRAVLRRPSSTLEAIEDLPCIAPPLRGGASWFGLPYRVQWIEAPILDASDPWDDDSQLALVAKAFFGAWRVEEGVALLVWQGEAEPLAAMTGLSDAPWSTRMRPWSIRFTVPG